MKVTWFVFLFVLVTMAATQTSSQKMVGGSSDVDFETDPDATAVAKRAGNTLLQRRMSVDGNEREVLDVIKATKQVVQGNLYEFTFKLLVKANGKIEVCTISAWSRPWLAEESQREIFEILECP